MNNLRFALRNLVKTPMVSLVAILSLGLGIGANTAIFSLFEQALLRKMPVQNPDELVNIRANGPRNGSNSTNNAGGIETIFSYPMFRDLEKANPEFAGLAAHRLIEVNLSFNGQTSSGDGMLVSGGYFPVLGLTPASGRLLSYDDDQKLGAHRVVVISNGYWREKFNSDSSVVGKGLLVNNVPMTIIGVAPEHFAGTTLGSRPQVFVPISMRDALFPGWQGLQERRSYWAYLFGRLKPGVTRQQAESAVHTRFLNIIRTTELPLQKGISERSRQRFLGQNLTLECGSRGQSNLLRVARTPLILLLSITGFVLLIACANIANLLLAKSANRAREFSIRLSLGATRAQVMSQLMAESVVLALLAGVAGLIVAEITTSGILALLARDQSEIFERSTRWITVGFTFGISLIAGFLFGLFPAIHATRIDLASSMKDQAGNLSASGAASHFRRVLVTAQIGLSLLLLISAGMFLKSLMNIVNVNLGMRTENVIGFRVSPGLSQYNGQRTLAFLEQLEAKANALPGVDGAAVSLVGLIVGNNYGSNVSVDGFQAGPDTDTHSMFNEVGAGFFKMLGVPLTGGREFTLADTATGPKVAVINEAFQRKFGNGKSLLGKQMQRGAGNKNDILIVGVVKDMKYSEVKDNVPPVFYVPYRQDAELGSASIYVTTKLPVDSVIPSLRKAVAELDPNIPLDGLNTLENSIKDNIGLDRMISTLAAAFAVLATLLAAIGLYGVLAFTVARRTREIGIRLAIGADSSDIRNLVFKDVAWMLGIGVVLGLPAAIALMRYSESLLYEIRSGDPVVLGSSVVLLCCIALLAGYLPARRAMNVEPQEALRYD